MTLCPQRVLGNCKRRMLLLGIGALTTSLLPANFLLAEEIPKDYRAFIDRTDGYSYVYPTDWREFNFMGHDSAFRDRNVQLQNVRVRFIPTEKNDIHDLGPMEKVEVMVFAPFIFSLIEILRSL
uniref:Uncharacterized protein MANES_10G034800 n=1 Tax=Rhizophora mucronata TaxID=61149 RepID=A0A2P2LJN3_RHIMU